jgi:DNA-binding NarL/FixJ family response regulator
MTTRIKLLLIEDDTKKIEDIKEFITNELLYEGLIVRESYQSGIREILQNDYDLLLLDMSIPTFDKTPLESGGPFEKFGGYKVLREITRKNRPVKTILITMFDDFGESDLSITLSQIDESLKQDFSSIYLGSVFYNATENKWKDDLRQILQIVSND